MRRSPILPSKALRGLQHLALALAVTGLGAGLEARPAHPELNNRGNVLIADRANNRVIEVDPQQQIVWQFGDGGAMPGATTLMGPCDAERIGQLTFMCAAGTPAGTPGCPQGCPDNRVIAVDPTGAIAWQYGQAGVSGSGPNELNQPVYAVLLHGQTVLITDQGNQRVLQVDWNGNLIWQYGMSGMPGSGANQLYNPSSAHLLRNGNVLIADTGNDRVIEVSRDPASSAGFNGIVWEYRSDSKTGCPLNGPTFACRLRDGNTLIADTGNNRVVEVTRGDLMVWLYNTSLRTGSVANPRPTRAVRLRNGHTLISDQFNQQVIEVTRAKDIVYTYGVLGQSLPMSLPGWLTLNGPHDAKAIGDFNGLPTPCQTPTGDDGPAE
jgi:hypothetical protein